MIYSTCAKWQKKQKDEEKNHVQWMKFVVLLCGFMELQRYGMAYIWYWICIILLKESTTNAALRKRSYVYSVPDDDISTRFSPHATHTNIHMNACRWYSLCKMNCWDEYRKKRMKLFKIAFTMQLNLFFRKTFTITQDKNTQQISHVLENTPLWWDQIHLMLFASLYVANIRAKKTILFDCTVAHIVYRQPSSAPAQDTVRFTGFRFPFAQFQPNIFSFYRICFRLLCVRNRQKLSIFYWPIDFHFCFAIYYNLILNLVHFTSISFECSLFPYSLFSSPHTYSVCVRMQFNFSENANLFLQYHHHYMEFFVGSGFATVINIRASSPHMNILIRLESHVVSHKSTQY